MEFSVIDIMSMMHCLLTGKSIMKKNQIKQVTRDMFVQRITSAQEAVQVGPRKDSRKRHSYHRRCQLHLKMSSGRKWRGEHRDTDDPDPV